MMQQNIIQQNTKMWLPLQLLYNVSVSILFCRVPWLHFGIADRKEKKMTHG